MLYERNLYEPSAAELNNMYARINFVVDNAEFDFFRSLDAAAREDDEVHLKVFSYMGRKDSAAGEALRDYLVAQGVQFKSTNPRAVTLKIDDFRKLFGEE